MSTLKTLVRDLVDRRLWPVAVVLAVALVAVPVFLLKSGSDTVPPAPSAESLRSAGADAAPETVVSAAPDATLKDEQRRLVGTPKDPFVGSAPEAPAVAAGAGSGAGSASGSGSGGSASPAASSPAPSVAPSAVSTPTARVPRQVTTAPSVSRSTHRYYVVDVRFGPLGRSSGDANVARLQPMPSSGRPALVYLGAFNGGSSAGFLVARGAVVAANSCLRRPTNCGVLRLRPGRTARIAAAGPNRTVRRYELSVQRIRKVTTTNARQARRARARVSRAGRCLLASDDNAFGSVMFDPNDGAYRSVTPGKGSCRGVSASASRASFPAVQSVPLG